MAEQQELPLTAAPLPTVVLGGWLGAGKTTLLNHWLREAGGLRLAVLVNDFGDISIDADLIVGADGDVISLAGGCICCAVGSDLFGALRRMTERQPRPDLLLVETSGVALPAAVARTVRLVPGIEVRAVVVLVDGLAWHEHLRDRYVADTVRQQVNEADLLVLTKLDAADPANGVIGVIAGIGAVETVALGHGRAMEDVSVWPDVDRQTGHVDRADGQDVRHSLETIAPRTPVLDARADAAVLRRAVMELEAMPLDAQENAGPPQVFLTPSGGGLGADQPWGRAQENAGPPRTGTLRPVAATLAPAASRFESQLESFDRPVDPQTLIASWTAQGAGVVRAKGWVTGLDGLRWRIQLVGQRANVVVDDKAPPGDRVVVIRARTGAALRQ
jgi:G3E family GTPase